MFRSFLIVMLFAFSGVAQAQTNEDASAALASGDFKLAVEIWRTLAEQGDPHAQTRLGLLHYQGRYVTRGVPKDVDYAVELWKLAAEQGHSQAQSILAGLYAKGEVLGRDDERAAELYQLAAAQGEGSAQWNLGDWYLEGRGGLKQDVAQAIYWYEKAGFNKERGASLTLGLMFLEGEIVPQDYERAYSWFNMAATGESFYYMGLMHEHGWGVLQNHSEAERLYSYGARDGMPEAQEAYDRLRK